MKKIYIKDAFNQKSSHPWIYRNHIKSVGSGIMPGDIVEIFSKDSKFIGKGYYNPASLISVRILSRDDEPINEKFFISRLSDAFRKREDMRKVTNAYRIVFSEADFLSGLIVDNYNDTVVFQINTLGMDLLKKDIISAIREVINPVCLYEKSDSTVRNSEGLKPAFGWQGNEGKGKIIISEEGVSFAVDILNGHKTGFYLDQRRSRIAAGTFAKGKRVLDVFCYAGAFSIHAAAGKALEVTAVDIKEEWLNCSRENADLNNLSDKITWIKSDAFKLLENYSQENRKFDMIILDPPSFLKNRGALKTALKGYTDLNRLAMKLLYEGGILCTFSCSHHMNNAVFSDIIKKSAMLEGKDFRILKRCHQDKDHPIVREIPETDYLKGYFLSVSSV